MPLVRGYMEYGPMPLRASISKARMEPSFLTAILPVTRWSRAWMSETKLSMRSATNLTGRLSSMASPAVAISSA